jgi:hypothetical protein
MSLIENKPLYGVQYGISIGQNERVDELNERILERSFPDMQLQPNFDPRPVSTKYSLFPIIDMKTTSSVRKLPYLDYHVEVGFNPGNSRGPVSGYINNVDTENELRNQNIKLYKGDLGTKYIPSLESDLYNVNIQSEPNNKLEEQHPYLFKKPILDQSSQNFVLSDKIGKDVFYNHTRTQLRNTL